MLLHPFQRFAFSVLAFGILASVASANQPIPVLFDARFNWNIDLKVGQDAFLPRAPWYTYFPADPNMSQAGPMTPFPNWPAQFPIYSPATGAQSGGAGPIVHWNTPTWVPYARPVVQPVGYYAPVWVPMWGR